jgi:hypothetical protein
MSNIFNKIITENLSNLEITMPMQLQESSRTPKRLDQSRTTPHHIIIKTTNTETIEKTLKGVGEKTKITCKVSLSKSQQISPWKPSNQEEHGVRSSRH